MPDNKTETTLLVMALRAARREGREQALEEAAEEFEQSVNHVWDKDEVAEFLRSKITAG